MKKTLSFLLFIPLFSSAQRVALLDRNFHQSIVTMEAATMEAATKGRLLVYEKDITTIIEGLQQLVKNLIGGGKVEPALNELKLGSTKCTVVAKKTGRWYTHYIVLHTTSQHIKTSILLAADENNKRAAQRLNIFIDYLRNNTPVANSL